MKKLLNINISVSNLKIIVKSRYSKPNMESDLNYGHNFINNSGSRVKFGYPKPDIYKYVYNQLGYHVKFR